MIYVVIITKCSGNWENKAHNNIVSDVYLKEAIGKVKAKVNPNGV